ncbi:LysM peptidoglycan-binding domain-containing protein [Thiotrichales bacterium HSG1]|nr:LysM peptidoglycan-binding domain-containing protein [Thiotrichales bacterium HSG1]
MKIFKIFCLLILSSLLGCNTLVTKPTVDKQPNVKKNDKAVYLLEPYKIGKTTDLTVLTAQSSPATFFWKDDSSLVESVKPSPKHLNHKRIKKVYSESNERKTKQNLTIKQTIVDALNTIPDKRRQFNDRNSRGNLWDKVHRGYSFPSVDNRQIQREINKFLSNPSYFQRISRKANPYLYHIVKEVEKRGLPMELALLPAIESAFEARAMSHKSASGLWQFIPATGRYYGLVRNKWYDGRNDIVASTNAALNYLKTLHTMFDNDWFLALAAYNYGEGNVGKAIRRNLNNNRPTDFWSLKLPRETREYVPKLLALAKIISNPKAYGINLPKINNQPYFERVSINRQIELSVAAKLATISVSDLKLLNPGYRRGVTSPKGPHNITLPTNKVYQFKHRLAQIPNNLKLTKTAAFVTKPTVKYKSKYRKISNIKVIPKKVKEVAKKTSSYQVVKGDTLHRIAKRYNTTVTKIRQFNGLDKKSSLKVGQSLIVSAKKFTPATSEKSNKKHRVRLGDNWWKLAKQYGTTVSLLKKLNNFKSNSLKVGKFLVVPN